MIDPIKSNVQLPVTLLDDKRVPVAVRTALRDFTELRAGYRDQERTVAVAQQAAAQAETLDTQALADAIRKGASEPERTAEAPRAEVEALERRLLAIERAVHDSFKALTSVIPEQEAKWVEALEQAEREDRQALVDTLDAIGTAESKLASTLSARIWLRNFPRTGAAKPAAVLSEVPGLEGPNGDSPTASVVIAALRRLAEGVLAYDVERRFAPGGDQRRFPAPGEHRAPSHQAGDQVFRAAPVLTVDVEAA